MEGQPQEPNQDDLIMKQQKEIEKEISEQYALISDELPINTLLNEYAEDAVFKKKVNSLGSLLIYLLTLRPLGRGYFAKIQIHEKR